jgi:hypothetical protein
MNKYLSNFIILIICIIFLGSCNIKLTSKIPKKPFYYKDVSANELFSKQRQMTDLVNHKLYTIGKEVSMDFWFNENTSKHQIDSAKSFVLIRLVLKEPSSLDVSPYNKIINKNYDSYKTVSSKIYLGDKLIYHYKYDEDRQLIELKNDSRN